MPDLTLLNAEERKWWDDMASARGWAATALPISLRTICNLRQRVAALEREKREHSLNHACHLIPAPPKEDDHAE